jgi:hypothetical protein
MLLRAIGVPFDAHEIDKGVMLGSVEVLRSLEEARRTAPPPGGPNEIGAEDGPPIAAESEGSR